VVVARVVVRRVVVVGLVVVVVFGLQTVPMVYDVVMQIAVRVVGVAVSRMLPVGRTPTVISAVP
jgi:hypothetical protein